jgi:hypothetical protein
MLIIGGCMGYSLGRRPGKNVFDKFMFMIEQTCREDLTDDKK